jgi:hypothetical protein
MRKSYDLERSCYVLLAALVMSTGTFASDKAYISTDDSGQTVISDIPPTTGTVEAVKVLPNHPQADAAKAEEEVQRIKETADQMAAERKQKEREREDAKAQKKHQQQSCAAARSRLEQLESQPPNRRLVIDPDGTSRRLGLQEMESLRAEAKRQVMEHCGALDPKAANPGGKSRD